MPLAKRLEFRAVAAIPAQERIENVADDADLKEVYDSEGAPARVQERSTRPAT